ncbi:uncharacterized protein F4807DRAFT_373505 [Annulohypoxylon truncatum]|uniref:uncharacterized protein n=1 Tax=Annulohypoxylon truncatum TaxID=327061 RepID=UPI00200867F4|nr:uncharacterized protein F4807DRAFT_373505 [Annulohypoxylon truncatum]KAI1212485.1 hypothetical protein F4807DRAFT_373505 [Annulohypoxylon truncatum]
MYPEGSVEDAKALQASFQRTRSPRRKGGTRGRAHTTNMGSTNNGTGSRQGNRNGAGQEPIGQHGYPQQHVNPQQHGQPQRVNPQHYEQSQQYGHSQQRGHFPASHDSYAPPQPQRPPFAQPEPRTSDLLDFNRPLPSQSTQRQENLPPQQHQPTVSAPAPAPAPAPVRLSLLDEKEEEINQPVMQFTGKNGSLEAQKADVAMNGTDEMEKPVTPPRYGGLSASRWNTENVNRPGSSYMDIDNDSSQEESSEVRRESQQRGLASPGRTVASGMVQGLGLRSSRWGS